MGKRTSIYLSSMVQGLVQQCGNPPLAELIEEAATARLNGGKGAAQERGERCPHPPARRAKGLCMACGVKVS